MQSAGGSLMQSILWLELSELPSRLITTGVARSRFSLLPRRQRRVLPTIPLEHQHRSRERTARHSAALGSQCRYTVPCRFGRFYLPPSSPRAHWRESSSSRFHSRSSSFPVALAILR